MLNSYKTQNNMSIFSSVKKLFLNKDSLTVKAKPSNAAVKNKQDKDTKKTTKWEKGDIILDTYEVEDIMAGGMGYVYIAKHNKWNVKMAIKSPNDLMLSKKPFFTRVVREADAWTGIGLHPHIAYCYYVRQIEEIPFIFIEYVDGGNLSDWIKKNKHTDLKLALDLAIQFCHGIEFSHSKGVIHRDIKPANILITKKGILKITDFGIAKSDDVFAESKDYDNENSSGQLTSIGMRMGSYDYMSPEQWEDAGSVDIRADIFSFGVCLYEMICGKRPYESSKEVSAAIRAKEKNSRPYYASSIREVIPAELSDIMKRSVALYKEERFSSFSKLREALTAVYKDLFQKLPPHAKAEYLDLKTDGLNNRAVSYMELGKRKEAKEIWGEALKLDPKHFESFFNIWYCKWKNGTISDINLLKKLKSIEKYNQLNSSYWLALSWIHLERGDVASINEIQNSNHKLKDREFNKAFLDNERPECEFVQAFEGNIGTVTSLAFLPDSKHFLSGSWGAPIRLWSIKKGLSIETFAGDSEDKFSISVSPDGCYCLLGSLDRDFQLCKVKTGENVKIFKGHNGYVKSVIFSPDATHCLSGSHDKTLRYWNIKSGKCINTFKGHKSGITSAAFSPDGKLCISGSEDNTVRLWDIDTGETIFKLTGHKKDVHSVSYSPDGKHFISGSWDKTIRLWNVENGKTITIFKGHTAHINCVAYSPDGKHFISGSGDKTLRLWDIETGQSVRIFERHTNEIKVIAYSPDGKFCISGGQDNILCLWKVLYPRKKFDSLILCKVTQTEQLHKEEEILSTYLHKAEDFIKKEMFPDAYIALTKAHELPGHIRDIKIRKSLAFCGRKGKGKRNRLNDSWLVHTMKGHIQGINSIALSPDGKIGISGSDDKTLRLWNIDTGKCFHIFKGHSGEITSVSFSPDGLNCLSSGADKTLRFWNVKTGDAIFAFNAHSSRINSAALSPDGFYCVSGSVDKTVCLWNIKNRKSVFTFEGHTDSVESVAFSRSGKYLLSGSWDKTVRLWDIETKKCIHTLSGHTGHISSVVFSPDEMTCFSASWDNTFCGWDLKTGKCFQVFKGHKGTVQTLAVSGDGKLCLSGSNDRTIRLWNVESGKVLHKFEGHTDSIKSVTFSPYEMGFLSGSADNTLKIWGLYLGWTFENSVSLT